MKRTQAEALLLVNWKGVSYRRYELDPGVTALEGANGAGKTTVMIAAYVVLMPDLTKLRFANLGEHERTGGDKGIYGRLGIGDRPSYAALDLRLGSGERLVAGVQLERGAEPSVKLESFLIHGLPDEAPLQSLFLDRVGAVESVPLLSRLKELTALAGGRLEHFQSAREYFTALFDRGVTPLRLGLEEERTKFNEMLRTSMVGGISGMLGSGLRSFLFREEGMLAETLKRMRQNLDECRRSRREVNESRRIEQELRGIYEPGRRMFAAALLATRQQASELRNAEEAARREHEAALERLRLKDAEWAKSRARTEELERRQLELEATHQAAKDRLDRTVRANGLAKRREEVAREEASARAAVERAGAEREKATKALDRAWAAEREAAEARENAAQGLESAEKGVQELHRRVGLHRLATSSKQGAERLLGREIDVAAVSELVGTLAGEVVQRDERAAEIDRKLRVAAVQKEAFFAAHATLARILEREVAPPAAYDAACEALRRGRELEALSRDRARVERERALVAGRVDRQKAARDLARRLSTTTTPLHSAADVLAAHEEARKALEFSRQRTEAGRGRVATAEQAAVAAEREAQALEPVRKRWAEARALADRLGETCGVTLSDANAVEDLRRRLDDERDAIRMGIGDDERRAGELASGLQLLEGAGTPREPGLQRLAQALGGEWLSERFDDVELDDAARIEARLGPLRDALVVESPAAAAERLAGEALTQSVWLVDVDTTAALRRAPEAAGKNVVVHEERAWRVTPLPERPVLGRRARQRRIEELRAELATVNERLVVARGQLRKTEALREEASHLHGVRFELDRADPGLQLAQLRETALRHRTEATVAREELLSFEAHERNARAREEELQNLRDRAPLLDEPDATTELAALDRRRVEIDAADRELARTRSDLDRLDARLADLREVPLDDAALEALTREQEAVRTERTRLFHARNQLVTLEQHREALAWTDAEAALAEAAAIAPALRAALEEAKRAQAAAEKARLGADESARQAQAAFNTADAAWNARRAELRTIEEDLARCEIPDPGDSAVEAARAEERRQVGLVGEARRDLGEQQKAAGRLEHEASGAAKDEAAKAEVLRQKGQQARPAHERWDALELRAREARVYDEALLEAPNLPAGNAIHLWHARGAPRAELLLRLRQAADGAELAEELDTRLSPSGDEPHGAVYLEAWLDLRAWLSRRVPAQISEGMDPVRALAALGSHLEFLADRLSVQEQQLRGEATSVAQNIRGLMAKAFTTVKKLNQDLRDVSFGSITSVQLRCDRHEQMERVLRALGGEAGQSTLFDANLPFEDALNQLFLDHGGRRDGGQRLLDYREYLDLRVEVKRGVSPTWETANPTRMSTGEAIGVGAAVMIVVLGAWERDAQFLRAKHSSSSLRFLFLDEASRLDKDTLGNLFELCSRLGLQLLIAAPEVARAERNTTYRLVRKVGTDGREAVEVVEVSGRRRRDSEAAA